MPRICLKNEGVQGAKCPVGGRLRFKRCAKKIIAIQISGLVAKRQAGRLFWTEKGEKVRKKLHSAVQLLAHLAAALVNKGL
jgi:hypothetical protein